MFPEWTWIVGLWIGAVVGSFLNVVIYRMPRGLSLGNPKHSFCPKCNTRLGVPDLVPLLSWAVLKGRCRHCGAKVSARYFVVELVTGAIWAGIWWQYFIASSEPAKGIAYSLASAALVAVIFIDWEFYIIPDQVNAFLLFVGLGYNIYLYAVRSPAASTYGVPSAVLGALLGVGLLGFLTLGGRIAFGKDAMGHGDIKMARGIGAVLFPAISVMSFGIAVALGAVLGILQVLFRAYADKRAGEAVADDQEEADGAEDSSYEPESIGSIVKCVFGYLVCLDVIGLFYPKLYIKWFNEDPFEPVVNLEGEQADDWEVERTMIPFGPYLALGAIVATVFEAQLRHGLDTYMKWAFGGPASLEHVLR